MKNLIIILFLLVGGSLVAQQKDTAFPFLNGRTTFGIKLGLTQSTLYGSEVNALSFTGKATAQNGFHVGITANSMIGKYFWLKHEILYTQKGAGVVLNDSINGNYNSNLRTSYIDLFPLNAAFHYKGIQLYAGAYISVLVDASIQRKDWNGVIHTDKSIFGDGNQFENKNKYLQKMDYGFNAGLEYEFKFGLNIGIKFVRGFAELIQYANSHTFSDPKLKYDIHNTNINFSVGYSLRSRKLK